MPIGHYIYWPSAHLSRLLSHLGLSRFCMRIEFLSEISGHSICETRDPSFKINYLPHLQTVQTYMTKYAINRPEYFLQFFCFSSPPGGFPWIWGIGQIRIICGAGVRGSRQPSANNPLAETGRSQLRYFRHLLRYQPEEQQKHGNCKN